MTLSDKVEDEWVWVWSCFSFFPLIHLLQPVTKKAFSSRLSMSGALEELCAEGFESSKIYWCAKQIIDLGNIN